MSEVLNDRGSVVPTHVTSLSRWIVDASNLLAASAGDEPLDSEARMRLQCRTLAAAQIKLRELRNQAFGEQIPFADPAWDIMLDLYTASLDGRRLSVSAVSIAAGVPATTGLRWIALLEKRGVIVRTSDPKDGRRTFLALTPSFLDQVDRFFRSIIASISDAESKSNRSSIIPSGK